MKALGQIADLPAYAGVGRGEARAGEQLEKIVKFFALGERVEEDRHRAEIERHRAKSHQVRGNARGFTANGAYRFSARRDFPAHQFFHGERVSHVVRKRREIIEPVSVRDKLVVLHVLGDFLVAAMQKTNVRSSLGNDLAIELEHQPQHAVRGRMRWPHVEHHLLADVGVAGSRSAASAAATRVTGSGDSISRVVNGMKAVTKLKALECQNDNIYAGE